MRRFLILPFLALIFFGCEKDFNGVVDPKVEPVPVGPQQLPFVVKSITFLPAEVIGKDSVQYLKIKLTNQAIPIRGVEIVLSATGSGVEPPFLFMAYDNGNSALGDSTAGDSVYSAFLLLSATLPRAEYQLSFTALDSMNGRHKITSQKFFFLGKNDAPVLSNLSAPDTLTVVDSLAFAVAVKATDAQGRSDIRSVYMVSYRPDGTTNGIEFPLLDDGIFPDNDANDSVYTAGFKVTSANTKGTYRFEFKAVDRSGAVGNVLNHFLLLR